MTDTTTPDDLEERLTEAFRAFDRLDAVPPEDALGVRPGRRRRRLAMVAAGLLLVGGAVAVAVVAGDDDAPSAEPMIYVGDAPGTPLVPGAPSLSATSLPTSAGDETVSTVPSADANHWCRGFVGQRGDDRIYDDCTPEIEFGIVDFVCTGLIGTDDVGRDGLTSCEPIAPNSAVPGIDTLPNTIPGPLVIPEVPDLFETTTYVVQEGDFPFAVASRFCMTVEQLNRANRDLPEYSSFFIGLEITVRAFDPGQPCQLIEETSYVVVEGDWPQRVADLHCITVADMLGYNGWRSADEFPFPGGTVLIPPGACPPTDG